MAALHVELASTPAGHPGRQTIEERIELLTSIGSILARSIDERRAADTPSASAPMPASVATPSVAALNSLYEELEQDRARLLDLAEATKAAREASTAAQAALREAELARHEARQSLEAKPSPEAEARAALATLRSRAAREEVHLRSLEIRSGRASRRSLEERVNTVEEQVRSVVEALRSAPSVETGVDPEQIEREGRLRRRLEAAQRDLATHELHLERSKARYTGSGRSSPALDEIETAQIERDAAAQIVAALEDQRVRLLAERDLRSRWLASVRDSMSSSQALEWQRDAASLADTSRRGVLQAQGRLADLRERADDLARRLADDALDPVLRSTLEQRHQAVTGLIAFHAADVQDLTHHENLQRRFGLFLQDTSGQIPIRDRVALVWNSVGNLWKYELTTVDDEPITVGNAVMAFFLISLGFSISRRLSLGLRHLIDSKLAVEPGVAGAVQTAVFYTLLVSFGLIALRTVNFPLTAFTFAGGALAIGIGFGSQNVMNNFISGLILMLERPVRANDLVEIENTHGLIENIGARSTRIRATDGRHLIVPNSFFLENNVINWTLSDDLLRTKVSVGVIYGSPTQLVEELIRQTLDENRKVLSSPRPIVIFSEFGDNSLNFDAHFWTRARSPMDVRRLGSEIRFRIDDLFREHGLVIAFPQRDVHLDSARPIEVRILGSDTESTPRAVQDEPDS